MRLGAISLDGCAAWERSLSVVAPLGSGLSRWLRFGVISPGGCASGRSRGCALRAGRDCAWRRSARASSLATSLDLRHRVSSRPCGPPTPHAYARRPSRPCGPPLPSHPLASRPRAWSSSSRARVSRRSRLRAPPLFPLMGSPLAITRRGPPAPARRPRLSPSCVAALPPPHGALASRHRASRPSRPRA
ncbi:hypothetical protein SAMN05421748_101888 [Paractinoplanes atraurantiacus]|uniref:Uncharacterized protein n=1 Tax=Paractinoplanes atraurantiacus TaxID=1036182 RepID=A0A285FE49_9ACTN|nr:hypothetical protein SAMN05421748_101888 [Actinoplanes atraurantiacus]